MKSITKILIFLSICMDIFLVGIQFLLLMWVKLILHTKLRIYITVFKINQNINFYISYNGTKTHMKILICYCYCCFCLCSCALLLQLIWLLRSIIPAFLKRIGRRVSRHSEVSPIVLSSPLEKFWQLSWSQLPPLPLHTYDCGPDSAQ